MKVFMCVQAHVAVEPKEQSAQLPCKLMPPSIEDITSPFQLATLP